MPNYGWGDYSDSFITGLGLARHERDRGDKLSAAKAERVEKAKERQAGLDKAYMGSKLAEGGVPYEQAVSSSGPAYDAFVQRMIDAGLSKQDLEAAQADWLRRRENPQPHAPGEKYIGERLKAVDARIKALDEKEKNTPKWYKPGFWEGPEFTADDAARRESLIKIGDSFIYGGRGIAPPTPTVPGREAAAVSPESRAARIQRLRQKYPGLGKK